MAAGWLDEVGGGRMDVFSAGSEPGDQINPIAVEVMAERGIDISANTPRLWTDPMLREADVIITMGCGDVCPVYPGKRYLDWDLPDPHGRPVEDVRPIRDEIEQRVRRLVEELGA
jgi:protein-tyrosine-phosphatase